jgi:hypothetical protein
MCSTDAVDSRLIYDATMLEPSTDEILMRLRAQTLRVLEEEERWRDSIGDQPWFPWVVASCAIALGAGLALVLR